MRETVLRERARHHRHGCDGLRDHPQHQGAPADLPRHTDEGILQIATGHIAGSSLPVGGESTHAVVSGHTGLPSARLFTGLDKLKKGDTFAFHVLERTYTYRVDRISVGPAERPFKTEHRVGYGLRDPGDLHAVRREHAPSAGARAPHREPGCRRHDRL
ncbi:sortase [Bifidobacterium dentium]|uniref:sortase n=1 Tax=Bifidobacterium dentium TaxID=1689 RepID=UPI003D173C5D